MTTNNGNDETRVGGTPAATPDEPSANRKTWLIGAAILLAGLLIGVGVAVAGGGGDDKKASDDSSSSSSSSTTLESTSTTASTVTSTTNGGGGTSPTQPSNDPKINSFSANRNSPASCTPPAPDVSIPVDPSVHVTLSWSTSNASGTQLYVNGGLYQNYGSSGSQELIHPCTDATYTYKLVASGPNGPDASQTKTFTVNNTST